MHDNVQHHHHSHVTSTNGFLFLLLLFVMSETASFVDPVFLARFGLYVACMHVIADRSCYLSSP